MIDNINPFKHLISLSNELSAIRLQEDYLLQCEKNNALINELSKELKALVIVQNVHTPEQFGQPADLHPDTLPELIRTASRFIFGQF